MVREDGSFGVEEVKVWGPNVLSFQLQVGQKEEERWHCMGTYLPSSNKAGDAQRAAADDGCDLRGAGRGMAHGLEQPERRPGLPKG